MNNQEFKLIVLQTLKNRKVFTEILPNFEVRTRCPFCGDSQKNFREGHFYLRINPSDNYPILYNCFKCPAKGILNYHDLEILGISGGNFKEGITTLNKTADRVTSQTYQFQEIKFEYDIPQTWNWNKIRYIEDRLGVRFTEDDLREMKVVTSLREFNLLNHIQQPNCKPNIANMLEVGYIGFMCNNNTHIIFRALSDQYSIRWYKYAITPLSVGQRLFYTMDTSLDLYTKDEIIINLAEGVMDTISIAHNLGYHGRDNVLNIAACGKYYNSILKYLYGIGIVGSNVTVNIFPDNDGTYDTSLEHYQKTLKTYSYFVNRINVFYNRKYKDCGVPKDQILLDKHII